MYELVLELRCEVAEEIVDGLCDRVGAAEDGAEVDEEDEEVLASWGYLDDEAADCVVEVDDGRLVVHVVGVFFVGVLVGVVIVQRALVVPRWDDVQMVVDRSSAFLYFLSLQQMQGCLWMPALDGVEMMFLAEVQAVNDMTGIELVQHSFHLHLHVMVEVSMATHVEIPRHFLYRERSFDPASIFVLNRVSHLFHLSVRILLPKELVVALINVLSILVEPPLFNRADVGMMRDHDILEVK